jgi:DNA-binding HxlR family transcriptional regulator
MDNAQAISPVEITMNIIGGKWKPLIIYFLLQRTMRFSELRRAIPIATQRMLTMQLRELEADGIVHREVYAEVPPRVEYSLTESGRSLKDILDTMLAWGMTYLHQHPDLVMRTPEDLQRG